MTEPALLFLPWARRGGPLALPEDQRSGHPPNQVDTTVGVDLNGGPGGSVSVRLLGPGEVTGVAPQQVIRSDPAPGTRTFESNYLALVEFDDPALPWLFTPASASAGRLRPWLCLVVVREQPGVTLLPPTRGALPVLRIGAPARPETELPDLTDSWAWAHAQVAVDGTLDDVQLSAALAGDPARNLSRLVCGRLLAEQTDYLACVVPTFEAGRRTGLGDDPEGAAGPAWRVAPGMAPVELPAYHHWRFATGPAGDFQSLALAIRGRPVADDFGTRAVDLSTSGLDVPGSDDTQVLMAGALLSLDAPVQRWSDPAMADRFAEALRDVLNAADGAPAAEPLLAPPRYGAGYRSAGGLGPGLESGRESGPAARWYEQLNTDPPARIAAALGTLVVQRQQETLMAAAWDQAADLRPAARLAGLTVLGFAIADSLHRRYLAPLEETRPEAGLMMLAPLWPSLLAAPPATPGVGFAAQWSPVRLPAAALGTAVRRATRSRGPAVRRAGTGPVTVPPRIDVLTRMAPASRLERVFEVAGGPLTFDVVGPSLPTPLAVGWSQLSAGTVEAMPPRPGFQVAATPAPQGPPRPLPFPGGGVFDGGVLDGEIVAFPEALRPEPGGVRPRDDPRRHPGTGTVDELRRERRRPDDPDGPDGPFDPDPVDPEPDPVDPEPEDPRPPRTDSAAAALFREVAARHLTAFIGPPPPPRDPMVAMAAGALFAEALAITTPLRTYGDALAGLLTTPLPPPAPDTPLPTLAFAPRFETPMARALAELGQHWLLPGLEGVPANTALALRTNGAFVESFLVGLNHEFGRELLWREFPSPLTATFFDRFWDAAVAVAEPPDIPPLATWADRALAAPTLREERFVLLLRSELIRRFPDAVVSATRPEADPPVSLLPSFRGSLDPDVSFFGFTIPLADADDWTVVIAEQPGAPRFGFEVGEAPVGVDHAPAPDATAARLAGRLRQLPARITIPVSVLLREPES